MSTCRQDELADTALEVHDPDGDAQRALEDEVHREVPAAAALGGDEPTLVAGPFQVGIQIAVRRHLDSGDSLARSADAKSALEHRS